MDRLGWGILATGGIARGFCGDLIKCEGHEIRAVCSRRMNNAQAFAKAYGSDVTQAYDNYPQMLNDPRVDVVYVATPHVFHFDNTVLALNAGKHVVCEKPIGMSLEEVRACAVLAKQKNLFLLEAVWMNFFPTIQQAQTWIAEGKIGKVLNLEANFDFLAPKDPQSRLNDLKLGGGALMDIGLYPLFFATHLLGEAKVIHGSCIKGETGADVLGYVSMEHKNQVRSHCRFTFLYDRPCEAYIHGENGYIKLEDRFFCGRNLSLHVNGQEAVHKSFDFDFHGYQFEIEASFDAIRAGKPETSTYPHSEMLSNHQLLADARDHLGISYS